MELKKKFAVFSLVLVIVALAAGGGTYAFIKNKTDQEKQDLQTQIAELSNSETVKKEPAIESESQTNQTYTEGSVAIDSTVYYEMSGRIWAYLPNTGRKSDLAMGSEPVVSPDKEKVAYYRGLGDEVTIYYYQGGKEYLFMETDMPNAKIEKWSLDGKYVVVDTGTSPQRGKYIYDFETKKELTLFGTVGRGYQWTEKNEVFYTDVSYNMARPGEITGTGLTKTDITGKKTKIKTPTELADYSIVNYKDSKIYFLKEEVKNNSDWADAEKITKTYWSIDSDGSNEKQASEEETKPYSSELDNQVKESVAKGYGDYGVSNYYVSKTDPNKILAILIQLKGDGKTFQWDDTTHDYVWKTVLVDLKEKKTQLIDSGKKAVW